MALRRIHPISRWAWLIVVAVLELAGCAHKPGLGPLPGQYAPPFSDSGEVPLESCWWMAFDDPELNRQIDGSLADNFSLIAAWERVRAADALTRREASDLWPDVNGFAQAEGTFFSDRPNQSLHTLGVDVAYQVDLWGEIGSRVEAERLRTMATRFDSHVVALTLSAAVAQTWFSLIEARAQVELLNEQIDSNIKGLVALEARFGIGLIPIADALRQRQLVESTREQLVVVQSRIDVLEHQLAVLQGRPSQAATYDTGAELPMLPPLPDTGLPAELVNRRPDVLRDYFALSAADQDLASAVSAQYPRLNLAASVTTVAESPENLFREWITSIAAQLIGPIFDGGQRRAEVDRTAAVARQRLNEYGQTVLQAFQEVEDALAREQYQRERLERLNTQLEFASKAKDSLYSQFFLNNEETDFLDLLNATTEEQRLQRTVLSARLDLVLNRIALYLALAGDVDACLPGFCRACPPEQVNGE